MKEYELMAYISKSNPQDEDLFDKMQELLNLDHLYGDLKSSERVCDLLKTVVSLKTNRIILVKEIMSWKELYINLEQYKSVFSEEYMIKMKNQQFSAFSTRYLNDIVYPLLNRMENTHKIFLNLTYRIAAWEINVDKIGKRLDIVIREYDNNIAANKNRKFN